MILFDIEGGSFYFQIQHLNQDLSTPKFVEPYGTTRQQTMIHEKIYTWLWM